jgi:hypothetical protein
LQVLANAEAETNNARRPQRVRTIAVAGERQWEDGSGQSPPSISCVTLVFPYPAMDAIFGPFEAGSQGPNIPHYSRLRFPSLVA